MKNKKGLLISLGAVLCLALLFFFLVLPNIQKANSEPDVGLQLVNGEYYYYDVEGNMLTGWQTIGGYKYYFLEETGCAVIGWFTDIDEKVYYFDSKARALVGEHEIEGEKYKFDENGVLVKAEAEGYTWQEKDGKYYCVDPSGEYLKGLQKVDAYWYYFDADGACQTGWHTIDGKLYYFSENTRHAPKGWVTLEGSTFYFGTEGNAYVGEHKIDGQNYKFDEKGRLIVSRGGGGATTKTPSSEAPANNNEGTIPTAPAVPSHTWKTGAGGEVYCVDKDGNPLKGLQTVDGILYYFNDSTGVRQSGVFELGGKTYYFDETSGQAKKGWQNSPASSGVKYYFLESGAAATGVNTLDGAVYAFDDKGVQLSGWQVIADKMYCFQGAGSAAVIGWHTQAVEPPEAQTFAVPNSANQFVYYFGKEGFALKGLVEIEKGLHYFGEDFALVTGWQEVAGETYAFGGQNGAALTGWQTRDGEKAGTYYISPNKFFALKNLQTVDGKIYYLGVNGVRQYGWIKLDSGQYYFDETEGSAAVNVFKEKTKDDESTDVFYFGAQGYAVTGLHKINEKNFLFDKSGVRLHGWQTHQTSRYYFDSENDGAAAVNQWKNDGEADIYLGNEGAIATGLTTIEGALYYLSSAGHKQTGLHKIADKYYLFDENGTALYNEQKVGENNYFFESGGAAATGIKVIGTDTYYFDKTTAIRQTGLIVSGGKTYFFNATSGKAVEGKYIAGANEYFFTSDGSALVGERKDGSITYVYDNDGVLKNTLYDSFEWFEDKDGNHYYAGKDNTFVKGLHKIEEKIYYFSEETGARQKGLLTVDGKLYLFAGEKDEALLGWQNNPDDAAKTYYFDRVIGYALGGLQMVDSERYYMDEISFERRYGWQEIGADKVRYLFAADTGIAAKGLLTDGGNTYYFEPAGLPYTGLLEQGDKLYFFGTGGIAQTGFVNVEGKQYYFNADTFTAEKGWKNGSGSDVFYFGDNFFALNGLQTIEDKIYYFAENVRLYGWQKIGGYNYLFHDSGEAVIGWHTDDSGTYYFGENGAAVVGKLSLDGVDYEFSPDGKLEKETRPEANTWFTDGTDHYYKDANGEYLKGLHTIEDFLYYFDETTGARQSGWIILANGQKYYFEQNGKACIGWFTDTDTKTYYFETAGFALTNAEREIDGKTYVFDKDGVSSEKGTASESGSEEASTSGSVSSESIPSDSSSSSSSQSVIEPEPEKGIWENDESGNFYYTFADGSKALGLVNIDGNIHYFDNEGIRQSGWKVIDGARYSFTGENDSALKGWNKIDGKWYNFNSETAAQGLSWQYRVDENEQKNTYFYFENGTQPENWKNVNGIKRYFFNDGQMALGWNVIEGKTYYFQTSGAPATGKFTVDGIEYLFGEDGALATGWRNDSSGNRYYYLDDGPVKGWHQVEGVWYNFDNSTGAQLLSWQVREQDGKTFKYYYDETGEPATGWKDISGGNHYFLEDGSLAYGWQFIADKWYVFNAETGAQLTGWQQRVDGESTHNYFYNEKGELPAQGWQSVDGATRYVNADGAMAQGWQAISGERYCFTEKGETLLGWKLVEERWYLFHSQTGAQQLGWQSRVASDGVTVKYFYDAAGQSPKAGWNDNLDGAKRFVLKDGQMAIGWLNISGAGYYFNVDGTFLTGAQMIGGVKYMFDDSGRYITAPVIASVNYDTGWSATKTVTVIANASDLLADKTLQYSFDGGLTWSTANQKAFTSGHTLAAGTIIVKDSLGSTAAYGTPIKLESANTVSTGIDVSMHQGTINWAAVAATGKVDYAIIRSLCWDADANGKKGAFAIDPYFEYNLYNAKANGIKVGTYLYSYAYKKADALDEVTKFYESAEIQRMIANGVWFDMPVYIDYEDPRILLNTGHLTKDQRTDIVRNGMDLLYQIGKNKYGVQTIPGFYSSSYFLKTTINGAQLQREGYEIWVASFGVAAHGWSPQPGIWQYSSTGRLSGISTDVDLNYCYKDYSFINGGKTPPAIASPNITVTDQNGNKVTGMEASILAQMVEAEVGGFNNEEVFKAQAVAAKSWLMYMNSQNYFAPQVALKAPRASVQTAVNSVVGQVLTYNGAAAFTPYYAYSNGTTNSGSYWGNTLQYLPSVSSSYDTEKAAITGTISKGDLKARIEAYYGAGTTNGYNVADWIKITSRNAAGYVTGVSICGRTETVDTFYQSIIRYVDGNGKTVYPIKSPSFTFTLENGSYWNFTSRGNGHGVGMSQYGSYRMAQSGKKYNEILAHYYPGTTLSKVY